MQAHEHHEAPLGTTTNTGLRCNGIVYLPDEVYVKGKFVHICSDRRRDMRRLREGEVVVFRRYPLQGPNSALPIKIGRPRMNEKSVRVPLEVCLVKNADFDGIEEWFLASTIDDA
jgi:hypothetical protein